ncbi:MAG: glycoside hydrolase family 73 protein [Acidobacteriaceae bacterium]
MTREEFLQQAIAAAEASSKSSGLLVGVTVAQAAIESAWGNSELSRKANNYFGIKAHGKHTVLEMPTTEVINGVAQKVTARFASYRNMAECFTCRDQLITNGAVYAEARTNARDPELFVRDLAKHWATDPNYAEKILKIYRENNLSNLDRGAEGAPS